MMTESQLPNCQGNRDEHFAERDKVAYFVSFLADFVDEIWFPIAEVMLLANSKDKNLTSFMFFLLLVFVYYKFF